MPSWQTAAVAAALLLSVSVPAGLAGAQSRPPNTANDGAVATEIERRLSADRDVNAQNVTIYVRDGVVTLSGRVPKEDAKRQAARIAGDVPGVEHVRNDLAVGLGRGHDAKSGPIPEQVPGEH
jgi:hypothetical protein